MEQKMTPEEKAFVASKIEEAKLIAYSLGERMFEATNDIGVSVHAACILYASTCAINSIDPRMAHELFDKIFMQIIEATQQPKGPVQ